MNCELRPSTIHGIGVFATRDIQAGEKCCIYDGKRLDVEHVEDNTYFVSIGGINIDGYKTPRNKIGIAQFINDASAPVYSEENIHYSYAALSLGEYFATSFMSSNIDLTREKNMIVAIANKNIRSGEELLFSYGLDYWAYILRQKYPSAASSILEAKKVVERSILKATRYMIENNLTGQEASRNTFIECVRLGIFMEIRA